MIVSAPQWFAIGGGVLLAAVPAFLVWRRSRPDALAKEQRRLKGVHLQGRLADAEVLDYEDGIVFYRYRASGVAYSASQDLRLSGFDMSRLSSQSLPGRVFIKYDLKNPANSIVHCGEWSGIRLPDSPPNSE
jgi:hypothetical protein